MKPFAPAVWLMLLGGLCFHSHAAQKAPLPAVMGGTIWYVGNRSPLKPTPLVELPVTSVRPEGWLREQLRLEADGFSGRMGELSPWCKFEGSAWVSPTGEGAHGWEEMPYWLKGFTDLGYLLGDKRIMAESRKWIDGILASQRPDGYFGSKTNLQNLDLWPNMLVLSALRSHYEATKDPRVVKFMTAYFQWLNTVPEEKLFPGSWQKFRGGENLDSIYWLYNRTGQSWLLDLAKRNHARTANWTTGIPTWHGVSLMQGFREPAQFFQQSQQKSDLEATVRNYGSIMSKYGQVPGGMFGADENAREGFTSPRQATETCAMVEFMASAEMLLGITGDRAWGDRCEDVAFNSLPAAMTPDLKALHYLTAPNQIQLDRRSKAPMIENEGDMFSYNPQQYRCCQHNAAFGWPYFAEHLWMTTPGDGLAAVLYAPNVVVATLGRGIEVRISEVTDYPFGDTITFNVSPSKHARFPLRLRIPAWCTQPKLTLNKKPAAMMMPAEGWVMIDRIWKQGDTVTLQLPMTITTRVWQGNRNAVSIDRGPLTYSLKISEKWQKYGGTDKWPAQEVFPTTPWNYGLVLDPKAPAKGFTVEKRPGRLASQPFNLESAPIILKAKGKRLPNWVQESNGLIGELPSSPTGSNEPVEDVTLIPMGCARLRVSAFPYIQP